MLIVVYEHIWLCDTKTGSWSVGDNRNMEGLRHKKNRNFNKHNPNGSKDSSVSTGARLHTGWNKNHDSIPGRGRDSKVSRSALRPKQPPLQWILGALPLGSKVARCQADQLPSFTAKVTNAWRGTSTSSVPSWIAEGQLYTRFRTK